MKDLTGQRPDRHTGRKTKYINPRKKRHPMVEGCRFLIFQNYKKQYFICWFRQFFLRLPCDPPFLTSWIPGFYDVRIALADRIFWKMFPRWRIKAGQDTCRLVYVCFSTASSASLLFQVLYSHFFHTGLSAYSDSRWIFFSLILSKIAFTTTSRPTIVILSSAYNR